jgi:hypothetical protein
MRWVIWAGLVAIAGWGALSCGGNSSNSAGDAGPGTAGASGQGGPVCPIGTPCPVPPASQGSVTIHFADPSQQAVMAGKQCAAGVHFANAPTTFDSAQYTTGTTRPSDVIVDGEKGRSLACKVAPKGDKFEVSATFQVPAFDKDARPLPIPTRVQLETTIGSGESGAPGTLMVADNATGEDTYESKACAFSVQPDVALNKKLAIGAGKAWGSVACPNYESMQSPSSSCSVDIGYFILENCIQQ